MITYQNYQWIIIEEDIATIGLNEEALDELGYVNEVALPDVGDDVLVDHPIAEVLSEEHTISLYCPFEGEVLEVNESLLEEPELVHQDCYDDGWIFKVQLPEPISEEDLRHQIEENA